MKHTTTKQAILRIAAIAAFAVLIVFSMTAASCFGGGGGRLSGSYAPSNDPSGSIAKVSFQGSEATWYALGTWIYKCKYSVSGDKLRFEKTTQYNKSHSLYFPGMEKMEDEKHNVDWTIIDSNTLRDGQRTLYKKL
jgi:hypothetical protein